MAAIFAFNCACCGRLHEGSPNIAYSSPWHYSQLTEEERTSIAKIGTDLCKITHADVTDYFVRCILEIPIEGVAEPFTWGVWSSLSESSFRRYVETYEAPVDGEVFFGWLCNRLPCYPDTISLPADIHVQLGGTRPKLRLHLGKADDHPLVMDQLNGISIARAQEIAEYVHRVG